MLTVSPTPCSVDAGEVPGVDPECEFARLCPELHVCTDRDGAPVTVGKACWSWARSQVRNESAAGLCGRCNERSRGPGGAAGDLCWWCADELQRRVELNRVCAESCFWQRPGQPHTVRCQQAGAAYDGFMAEEADWPVAS